VRLRAERPNHVWSNDFVSTKTHDGRSVRLLTLVDEYTREALAIKVACRLNSVNVIEAMADVMLVKGVPEHIRSDNGPEMTANIIRDWLPKVGANTLYIEPGSPWENGYCESFNGKPRDEFLNGEIFYSLRCIPGSARKSRRNCCGRFSKSAARRAYTSSKSSPISAAGALCISRPTET